MANKRFKFCDTKDRISALPDPIVQHILSYLPSTRDGIRTAILSKRWRHQWTQVPVLIFESGDERNGFIENTLIFHDCPKIKKLHLHYNFKSDSRFTTKLVFAVRKCVQELILSCSCDYLLPRLLFDNAYLVRLDMVNCHFMPNWRINWPSLKCLKMNCDDGSCSEGIDNVVSSCPLLERLEFHGILLGDVAIVSRSLKRLNFVDVKVPNSITISCPNLEEFNVITENSDDNTFPIKIIENVLLESPLIRSMTLVECYGSKLDNIVVTSESLEVLHLEYTEFAAIEVSCPNLKKLDLLCFCRQTVKVVNLPSFVSVSLNLYPHNMVEFLLQFQHVNTLTIGRALFKNILELGLGDRLSLPSLNCKCLTLTVGGNFGVAMPGIAYALSSPMLETLVINSEFMCMNDSLANDYWNSTGCTGFTCLESHLKTVKIIGKCGKNGGCKRVFEFIEFLLHNARVLEKMIVLLKEPWTGFELEFSKKLLSLPRYSRFARVELCST